MVKKILHVCKVYLPHKGGVQAVVSKIFSGLNNHYQQEILTTSKSKARADDENILLARSLLQVKSLPIAPSIISKLWKKLGSVDMVCIHYPFPLADIAIATYPFQKPIIVVYWHSEIVSQKYLKVILRPFTKRMLRLADKIIVSSPEMVKHS
ncbi:MAG: glycosyltransferase involved in cell wall biosynthesis, partial [Arenicella sp.]